MKIVLFIAMYFLPWIVAASRRHHNRDSIAVINFLLGWTGLGWIIALAWAVSAVHPPVKTA